MPSEIKTSDAQLRGQLWVVATPLGNPADLSPRARQALAAADCVLAEDTRRSGLLLAACGVKAAGFMSLHDHNEEARIPLLLEELRQGRNFALVSDAGTPLLSDPGYRLVRACRQEGIRVVPLPGPSAPLTALCASGIPPQPFVFLGFPPRKRGEREKFFRPYSALPATLVFFERKDRLKATLAGLYEIGGEREICVCRELTKTHEEFIFFKLSKWNELSEDLLGEITVLAGPPQARSSLPAGELLALAEELRAEAAGAVPQGGRHKSGRSGLKPRELARLLHRRVPDWSVDEIYSLLLEQPKRN